MSLINLDEPTKIGSNDERGFVLYIAIVMLFIMGLIGLSGLLISTNTERMSANDRDRNVSFQAAETALLAGERAAIELMNSSSPYKDMPPHLIFQEPTAANVDGLYMMKPGLALWKTTAFDVWVNGSVEVNQFDTVTTTGLKPRYILEFISEIDDDNRSSSYINQNQYGEFQGRPDPMWFLRVTALGYGTNARTSTMLQSLVRVEHQ